ncbi:hypothetical protein [Streptomyces sp. NPDC050504]|uniref:hypothetical protein n=1 Tax=Streptomyces sp. NPDC050504 TaxID=3365618 RepID=UPI00378A804D
MMSVPNPGSPYYSRRPEPRPARPVKAALRCVEAPATAAPDAVPPDHPREPRGERSAPLPQERGD